MTFLFDSRGRHIANLVNGQLYAPSGQNVGHFMKDRNIFIDMNGRYLGEILHSNRLLYKIGNAYSGISFGNYGNYGNAGNYGNPGNHGSIGMIAGYQDVKITW